MGTQLQGPQVQMKMTGHFTITQSRSERVKGLSQKKFSCTVFKTNLSGEKVNENQCRELCITRFVLFCYVIVISPEL